MASQSKGVPSFLKTHLQWFVLCANLEAQIQIDTLLSFLAKLHPKYSVQAILFVSVELLAPNVSV